MDSKLTRTVEAIRNAQLLLPPELIEPQVLNVCGMLLTAGQELPVERAQQHIWRALNAQIEETNQRLTSIPLLARLLALVLLIIILACNLCLAAMPWLRSFFWNDDIFHVEISPGSTGQGIPWNQPDAILGRDFILALGELDITTPLPTWLPKGYSLLNVETWSDGELWDRVIGYYGKPDSVELLIIEVNQWQADAWDADVLTNAEKDTQPLDTYWLGSAMVTLYRNLDFLCARFLAEPCIIEITGNGITYDELRQIVFSADE